MNDFVSSILCHVESVNQDAQLEGILLENKNVGPRSRPNYFYLTDLVNPQQAYWEHIDKAPEHTDEQRRLFAHGNRMESVARSAFSLIDGITGEEATLDGAENDLPGVRGRIDFRYGNSLVEFKTSNYKIETGEDVWQKTPQNVEQLLFYSSLWAFKTSEHYLVYHLGDGPSSVRVFSVKIEDQGLLQNKLKSRKTNLEWAIDENKPSIVRKCRYYDNCHIKASGECNCDELNELDTEPFQRASEIERDKEIEEIMIEAFEKVAARPNSVGSWDLETPRRWYGRQTGQRERDSWSPNETWADDALAAADLLPGLFDDQYIPKIEDPIEFDPSGMMIKRSHTTGNGANNRWVPALYRMKQYDTPPKPSKLKNQIMQLGCACSLAEKGTGNLIVELPNSDTEIIVYRVVFNNLNNIKSKIIDRLEKMKKAIDEEDTDILPTCPGWLQDMNCGNCLCD